MGCKSSGTGGFQKAETSPGQRRLSFPRERVEPANKKGFYHYRAAEPARAPNLFKLLRRKISEQIWAQDSFGKSSQPASLRGAKIISTYK